jgi:hypothetical protein
MLVGISTLTRQGRRQAGLPVGSKQSDLIGWPESAERRIGQED